MPTPSPNKLVLVLDRLQVPIGTMLVVTDLDGRLRALDWDDYESRMHRLLRLHYGELRDSRESRESRGESRSARAEGVELRDGRMPASVRDALKAYFDGDLAAIEAISVATGGTAFQREVWKALRTIPAGETRSYGALAKEIARPAAVRAVGLANGANPIGVVVPCHRVIGKDASLTGYGGGIERKRWLLTHEGVR